MFTRGKGVGSECLLLHPACSDGSSLLKNRKESRITDVGLQKEDPWTLPPPQGPQTPGLLGPHFENCWLRGPFRLAREHVAGCFPGAGWGQGSRRRWNLAGWEGGEAQPMSGASKGGVRTRNAVSCNGGVVQAFGGA